LRLFSFGGYGLALAALALVVFGAIECPPCGAISCLGEGSTGITPVLVNFLDYNEKSGIVKLTKNQ